MPKPIKPIKLHDDCLTFYTHKTLSRAVKRMKDKLREGKGSSTLICEKGYKRVVFLLAYNNVVFVTLAKEEDIKRIEALYWVKATLLYVYVSEETARKIRDTKVCYALVDNAHLIDTEFNKLKLANFVQRCFI